MSKKSTKRPLRADLERLIKSGFTLVKIAKKYGVHNDTVHKWRIHYDIDAVAGINKPQDIVFGKATVVALITKEGEPGKYAVPGGGEKVGADEAMRQCVIMNKEMGG